MTIQSLMDNDYVDNKYVKEDIEHLLIAIRNIQDDTDADAIKSHKKLAKSLKQVSTEYARLLKKQADIKTSMALSRKQVAAIYKRDVDDEFMIKNYSMDKSEINKHGVKRYIENTLERLLNTFSKEYSRYTNNAMNKDKLLSAKSLLSKYSAIVESYLSNNDNPVEILTIESLDKTIEDLKENPNLNNAFTRYFKLRNIENPSDVLAMGLIKGLTSNTVASTLSNYLSNYKPSRKGDIDKKETMSTIDAINDYNVLHRDYLRLLSICSNTLLEQLD